MSKTTTRAATADPRSREKASAGLAAELRWLDAGKRLRRRNPELFATQLLAIESAIACGILGARKAGAQ